MGYVSMAGLAKRIGREEVWDIVHQHFDILGELTVPNLAKVAGIEPKTA